MWGLRFLNAKLSGRMWEPRFCSTERKLGTIDCSLDGKMAEEKKNLRSYFFFAETYTFHLGQIENSAQIVKDRKS